MMATALDWQSSADRVGAVPLRTSDDSDSSNRSSSSSSSSQHVAPSATATAAAASPFRSPSKVTERWMSFSWFVGLHVPILLGLCTGNTALARSMWPASFFDDPEADARASQAAGNIDRPVPRSIPAIYGAWYPLLFFFTLALTACFYFGTALSYPGYVGTEYRKHCLEQEELEAEAAGLAGTSSCSSPRARNGYSRVHELDGRASPRAGSNDGEVRMDIHAPHVRRILVDSSTAEQQPPSYDSSTAARLSPRSLARSTAMPASALGEAEEAAELSIGCAPPLAQPIMRSLGIGRSQLHASDQTEDEESKQSADQRAGREAAASASGDIELTTLHDPAISNDAPAASNDSLDASPAAISRACGYCSLCKLIKPARAKHCYKCKQCIQKFDHHCPWVANCIGRANHRYFLTYCLLQTVSMVWGISLNMDPFFHDPPLSAWYSHSALMLLMVMQLMVCGMLGAFHLWLSVTNQTTYHVIKIQDEEKARQPGGDTPARRLARREAARRRGEVSSDDDDDEHASAADATGVLAHLPPAPPLTTTTYHEGYFRNILHFWRAQVPLEHALPRSILIDGTWRHLPHAIVELREATERITGDEPPEVRRVEIAAMNRDYNAEAAARAARDGNANLARSSVVHMQWAGSDSLADANAIPDTPPLSGRDVYTRPVRVLGHCKVPAHGATAKSVPQAHPPPMELDTDEDPDVQSSTSVRL